MYQAPGVLVSRPLLNTLLPVDFAPAPGRKCVASVVGGVAQIRRHVSDRERGLASGMRPVRLGAAREVSDGWCQAYDGWARVGIARRVVCTAHCLTDDEKMTPGRIAGVIVGFIGAAVFIGPSALQQLGAESFAQLAVLGAAVSSFAGVFGRRFRGQSPLVVATGQLTGTTVMMAPLLSTAATSRG